MSKTSTRSVLSRLLTLLLAAAILAPTGAVAKTLEDLRKEGTVGERWDGYAVVRAAGAADEVKAQVKEINDRRREIYEKRAREEGVEAEQVGRIYARKIYEEAPAGTWFLTEEGSWVQKK